MLARLRVPAALTCAALLAACVSSCATGPSARGIPSSGIIQGKPKVGSSITHSQMCECVTCDPPKCCEGADDTASPDTCADGSEHQTADEVQDFTASACQVVIRSCQSRCQKQVWRVLLAERCDDKRPASCCG